MNENETYLGENIVCEIVHLKDGTYGISLYGDLLVTVDYLNTNAYVIHKLSQKVIVNITVEYCSKFGNFGPLLAIAFEWFKTFANNVIHACPYTPIKHFGAENIPVNKLLNQALDLFPGVIKIERGEYLGMVIVRDRDGRKVFYIKTVATVSQRRGRKSG